MDLYFFAILGLILVSALLAGIMFVEIIVFIAIVKEKKYRKELEKLEEEEND